MAGTDLTIALAKAREYEKAGRLKEAYRTYLRAGSIQDAARLLSASGKSKDAGRLILGVLKIEPNQVASLNPSKRKLAYLAATYFSKDKNSSGIAVEIFSALGETNRAAELLERTGDIVGAERVRASRMSFNQPTRSAVPAFAVSGSAMNRHAALRLERDGKLDLAVKAYMQIKNYGEAGRVLQTMNKPAEAAHMYAEGGLPYEAALCYLKVGDTGKGLDNLVRVSKADPRYRSAVTQAAKVAWKLGVLNFQLEHFIAEFVESTPTSEGELDTFYYLGELYEKHNLLTNAKEVFQKILDRSPGYRDVENKITLLGRYTKESSAVYDRIKGQDEAFRGDRVRSIPSPRPDGRVDLPPLPDIPDLPPPPRITGLDIPKADAPAKPDPRPEPPSPERSQKPAVDSTMTIHDEQKNEDDSGFTPGNTIENRYRLDLELGRGGMAVVFGAHDLELEEDIALKVFLQQVIDPKMQKESLERFKQELKLSRQLNHPNIIRLYDIGMHGGHRYISMELLRGTVLEDLMGQPMDLSRGLSYLIQACVGLQVVHDKGVIHRDIKPDNIFICSDETVKIMDFGIAKNTAGKGLTIQGMTAGTPEYIAPEQISSFSEVTQAADQYALGAIAFRMFTGQLLFEHEDLTPLLMMHLNRPPTPPREVNPDIPAQLEQIILRLLAKKPDQRFESCKELASYLGQVQKGIR